jgi:DNA-binding winged helix-turn-helix (wHTH) protein
MSLNGNDIFEFGGFRLEAGERLLLRAGEPVALPPKAFDVLLVLVRRAGKLVSKDELLKTVWADTFVEEANLSYTVSLLRRTLAPGGDERLIDTVQKLGYRFVLPVRAVPAPTAVPSAPAGTAQAPPQSAQTGGRWTPRWRPVAAVPFVAALLVLTASAMLALAAARPAARPDRGPLRFDVELPGDLTLAWYDHPAIAPDGRRVAFAAASGGMRRIWVRALDARGATSLEGTEGARSPFWSPDGERIAFFVHGALKTVAAAGGPVLTLCPAPGATSGVWTRSGVLVFGGGPISRVAETGGTPEAIAHDPMAGKARQEVIGLLADGVHVVYADERTPRRYWVASSVGRAAPRELRVSPDVRRVMAAGNHLLYERDGVLVAHAFDAQALQLHGAAVPLGEAEVSFVRPSASRNGVVVFRSGREAPRELTWRSRIGARIETVGRADDYWQVELSPSGSRAVVVRGGARVEDNDLWLLDVPRSALSRLTAHRGVEADAAWSPDERRIAYTSAQAGPVTAFVKDLASGTETRLLTAGGPFTVDDWLSSGAVLARDFGQGIYALEAGSAGKPRRLVETPYVEDQIQASPAGSWVAFNSDESDGWEVYVARLPGFTDKRLVSRGGGVQPRWRADGRELFYLALDGTLMAVEVGPGTSPALGLPRPLFETAIREPNPEIPQYDVTADGQRFLLLEPTASSRPRFTFLIDWLR